MYKCDTCNYLVNDAMSLQKHRWLKHPSNEYEKKWSDLYYSGELFSGKYTMSYQDDPYN